MTKTDREDMQILTGEYVLGTLEEDARKEFEKNRAENAVLCKYADDWERDLSRLTDALPDIEPPGDAWQKIQQAIQPSGNAAAPDRIQRWRIAAFLLGGLSLALLVLLLFFTQ